MSISAGTLRELRKTARGEWNKIGKWRRQELIDLGLVRVEYEDPEVTPAGSQALKESN